MSGTEQPRWLEHQVNHQVFNAEQRPLPLRLDGPRPKYMLLFRGSNRFFKELLEQLRKTNG
jgi:hypothetical protein